MRVTVTKEEWKPININGFETIYDVSNYGQIRNRKTGYILKMALSGNERYLNMPFYIHRVLYKRLVHRLVAEAFVPNPDVKTFVQVDHIDGNRLNNRADNLEWVTAKENKRRSIEMGLWNPRHGNQKKGSENGISTHTEEQATAVCKLLEENKLNLLEIANKVGVDYDFVRSIKKGHAWMHVAKDYNIPKPIPHNIRPVEMRDQMKELITKGGLTNDEIMKKVGLNTGSINDKRYFLNFKNTYLRDKSSTTIPAAKAI